MAVQSPPIHWSNRVDFRQARIVVVLALLLGIVASGLQIYLDYRAQRRDFPKVTTQVLSTIKTSAIQAAWEMDSALALKIADGLFEYRPIVAVSIVTEFGRELASKVRPAEPLPMAGLAEFLFGSAIEHRIPLQVGSGAARRAGTLVVMAAPHEMASAFIARAETALLSGLARNFLFALVLLFTFHFTLTRPLRHIVSSLSHIDPAAPGKVQLTVPSGHPRDEFAFLVDRANEMLSAIDVNDQRRRDAEDRRRSAESQLRAAVENMPEGVLLFDADGGLVLYNQQYMRFQPDLGDAIHVGMAHEDLAAAIAQRGGVTATDGDRDRWIHRNQELRRDPGQDIEWRLADGRWIRISNHLAPDGGMITVVSDISGLKNAATELEALVAERTHALTAANASLTSEIETRRRAEELLQGARDEADKANQRLLAAIDAMSESFVLYDAEDKLVQCNGKFADFFGHEDSLLFSGQRWETLNQKCLERGWFSAETLAEFHGRTNRRREGPRDAMEVKLTDGRWLHVRDHRIDNGDILSLGTDITERRAAEQALRVANAELAEVNHAKSAFLASMSHELRTPLNSVIGYSEVILGQHFGPIDSPRYLDYLKYVRDSGRHLLSLVNDILDLSKIEAGELTLYEERMAPREAINAVVAMVRPQADNKNLTLAIDPGAAEIVLHADERAFRQITTNLLSNAIKFTPDGGRVSVTAARDDAENYVLSVADTGVGIAEADLASVFQPFRQTEAGIARDHPGTGLGLAITKSLVELHGGTITLDSEPGEGTRVTAIFPAFRLSGG